MDKFTKKRVSIALSELSINLASGWLGVVLISPGIINVSWELVIINIVSAIFSLIFGIVLMQNE